MFRKKNKKKNDKKETVKKSDDGDSLNSRPAGMRSITTSLGVPCPRCAKRNVKPPVPSLVKNIFNRNLECEVCAFYLTSGELMRATTAGSFSDIVDRRILEMARAAVVDKTTAPIVKREIENSESKTVIKIIERKRSKRNVDF